MNDRSIDSVISNLDQLETCDSIEICFDAESSEEDIDIRGTVVPISGPAVVLIKPDADRIEVLAHLFAISEFLEASLSAEHQSFAELLRKEKERIGSYRTALTDRETDSDNSAVRFVEVEEGFDIHVDLGGMPEESITAIS